MIGQPPAEGISPQISVPHALEIVRRGLLADPALIHMAHTRLRETGLFDLKPTQEVKAFPATFAACEISVFDNWGGTVRPKGNKSSKIATNRFAAKIKTWEEGKKLDLREPDFTGFANFIKPDELDATVKRLSDPKKCRTPLSSDYQNYLLNDLKTLAKGSGYLIGLLISKPVGAGTHYHNRQVMLIEETGLDKMVVRAAVFLIGDKVIAAARFVGADSSGKPLKGRCFAQSRCCTTQQLHAWKTGNIRNAGD